jgi:hypothetical protein
MADAGNVEACAEADGAGCSERLQPIRKTAVRLAIAGANVLSALLLRETGMGRQVGKLKDGGGWIAATAPFPAGKGKRLDARLI